MKSFGSNFHRVITYVIMAFTRIHVITRSRVWRERISHNKERNGDEKSLAESWPDFVQKPIDKRKSGNVGWLLSSRHRINPWFTIVQSLFILTLSRETIDSARFNSRVPTHYTLPRIYVVSILRILGFVIYVHRGLLSVGLRAYLSGLNLLISRQILICKYGKLSKYLNTGFGIFFESA